LSVLPYSHTEHKINIPKNNIFIDKCTEKWYIISMMIEVNNLTKADKMRIETNQKTFGKKTQKIVIGLNIVSYIKKHGTAMSQLINFYNKDHKHIGYWSNQTSVPALVIF